VQFSKPGVRLTLGDNYASKAPYQVCIESSAKLALISLSLAEAI